MKSTDTNVRMRALDRNGQLAEEQARRMADADASLGRILAQQLAEVPAASLVETYRFEPGGKPFYVYSARPYGERVILVKDSETAAAVMSHYAITDTIELGAEGFTTNNRTGPIVAGVFKGGAGTFAHELPHIALRVLARNGVRRVMIGDEERMAYLCGDLFDAFQSYL
ncbi:hypothetical protein [Caballeronia sp. AZ10_KS36]|uniref:hypothetical protein n=1 Tax=Caballeronia sp. AZ10_KS36 TaxID=2921757 RepID=UPI0020281680|nr:hypothetical protein [Caballeronia sp. AZ10_KS36]